ncbi:MAG: putative zinc-binding protein [Pedobacter sp.]
MNTSKPLIYSCSGCSSAAQMANYIAVKLDRLGIADMSCIVGVGGGVKKLVRTALSGRKIIVLDGCPLACSRACLSHYEILPDLHIDLSSLGVSKKEHEDFSQEQADEIIEQLLLRISMDETLQSTTLVDHT